MPLLGDQNKIKPFLDTASKMRDIEDAFNRLSQGRNTGKVPEAQFQEVRKKLNEAAVLQKNAFDLESQKDALKKMETAFSGLDEKLMAIAKFGEKFTENAGNVNVMGNIKVDLTDLAKTFFKIKDSVEDLDIYKNGSPPSSVPGPGSRSHRPGG